MTMKCWCVVILILQTCSFLLADTEVQRFPDQDDIHVTEGIQVILKFRLLADADLTQFEMRYRINNSIIQIPNEKLDFDSTYSATLRECEEESSRQCRELVILITGSPSIHAHTFTPDFINLANLHIRDRVVTDKLFRIHYQDGSTTSPPTTAEPTEPSTTQPTTSSTAQPTSTSAQCPPQTSPQAIDLALNKDSLEDVSTIDYVMFAVLFSLAITVAVSIFINIVLCFKLKRSDQELKHYSTNSEIV